MQMIKDWQDGDAERFGKENLQRQHALNETNLFSKEALAELIDRIPESYYDLTTMGYDVKNPMWREGVVKNLSGKEVVECIERGRMWMNLRNVNSFDARYKKVLDDIFDQFEERVPGFETFKRKLGILISSPKVQVFYHCDIPGQALWQLSGDKKLYVYPTTPKFMSQESLEGIFLGETEEEIPYEPEFDEEATIYDLKPGQMVHWPLNGPHRVVNENSLNISVTTEHWTDDIRKWYAVNYANGVLRRNFGMKNLSQSITGPMVYPKAALALAWRKLKLNEGKKVVRKVDFTLDPFSETGMVDIPAYAKPT